MAQVTFVACVGGKLRGCAPAGSLYTSDWFIKAREIARRGDYWYILSAKHGVIRPTQSIDPYELTLNTMAAITRKVWADDVIKSLERILSPNDVVTVLAGERYREHLLGPMQNLAKSVHVPMEGLSIGQQLQWMKKEHESRSEPVQVIDLERFYRLIAELQGHLGTRLLSDTTSASSWPRRGVYFFFEPGEFRNASPIDPRVVRVGTHAVSIGSKSSLWSRVRTHRGDSNGGGSHRSSIFRLHVGTALMARDSLASLTWGKGQSAATEIRDAEQPIELAVSKYLARMSVLHLAILDDPSASSDRSFIEQNSIALLSNRLNPVDKPSSGWLGRLSVRPDIAASGLWNLNYVKSGYRRDFLDVLADYVQITIGKLPAPMTSIAPTNWHNTQSSSTDQFNLF